MDILSKLINLLESHRGGSLGFIAQQLGVDKYNPELTTILNYLTSTGKLHKTIQPASLGIDGEADPNQISHSIEYFSLPERIASPTEPDIQG